MTKNNGTYIITQTAIGFVSFHLAVVTLYRTRSAKSQRLTNPQKKNKEEASQNAGILY